MTTEDASANSQESAGETATAVDPILTDSALVNQLQPELNLREWSPMTNLLAKIPHKAQRGLLTQDLNLTCISATSEFIALGTNVGLVYWYNRKDDSLQRLKVENNHSAISALKVVSSVDYMLAAGNKDGIIVIFQISKISEQDSKENVNVIRKPVQRYIVNDLHKYPITALEWSVNGMKLFSGDYCGNIVLTEMDFCMGISKSIHLLDEKKEIVQLSYAHMNLLISSVFRTIIYSLETKQSHKVGTQDRKLLGKYGAIFESGLWTKKHKIFAARPGGRLWIASLSGTVECTGNLKESSRASHPHIPIINPTAAKKRLPEIQLEILHHFNGNKHLLTSHKNILYVIDPTNMRILGSCQELRGILSVSVSQNEIFILESSRSVIRISDEPDKLAHSSNTENSHSGRGIPDIMGASIADFRLPQEPFTYFTSKLKETSRALPKVNISFLNTIKNMIEADIDIQDGQLTTVIPMREAHIPPTNANIDDSSLAEAFDTSSSTENFSSTNLSPESRFDNVSAMPYEEVLVAQFRPLKPKKKKKYTKSTEKSDTVSEISDTMSVSSFYSSNSEGDTFCSSNSRQGQHQQRKSPFHLRKISAGSSQPLISSCFAELPVDSTTNFESSGESQLESTKTLQYIPIPVTLDSNATFFPHVSHDDVEIKEEILARRLNWPELLPNSSEGTLKDFYDDNYDKSDSGRLSTHEHQIQHSASSSSRETPETLKDDSLTINNGAHVDNSSLQSHASDADFPLESSLDIYTRYRPRDDHSLSSFSFGPPSGSSNVNSLCMDDNVQVSERSLLDELEDGKKEMNDNNKREENNIVVEVASPDDEFADWEIV